MKRQNLSFVQFGTFAALLAAILVVMTTQSGQLHAALASAHNARAAQDSHPEPFRTEGMLEFKGAGDKLDVELVERLKSFGVTQLRYRDSALPGTSRPTALLNGRDYQFLHQTYLDVGDFLVDLAEPTRRVFVGRVPQGARTAQREMRFLNIELRDTIRELERTRQDEAYRKTGTF